MLKLANMYVHILYNLGSLCTSEAPEIIVSECKRVEEGI